MLHAPTSIRLGSHAITIGNMTWSESFLVIPRFLRADATMSIFEIRSLDVYPMVLKCPVVPLVVNSRSIFVADTP